MVTEGALRVVQLAHPVDTLPTTRYGGIGRVVEALTAAHCVVATVANSGSRGRGVLAAGTSAASIVGRAGEIPDVDAYLAHSSDVAAAASHAFGPARVVEMLHMPVTEPGKTARTPHGLLGVSRNQVGQLAAFGRTVPWLWHSTPLRPAGSGSGGYAAWVGRMSPTKGPLDAIAAATAAGVPLVLIGGATNDDEAAHLEQHVRPALGPAVKWLGELSGADRDAVVGDAVALLAPTGWDEPFGLTVIEAAMLGTPVLGYRRGATTEIVSTGIGRLCSDTTEMAAHLVDVIDGRIDRDAVRAAALENFAPAVQTGKLEAALSSALLCTLHQ